MNRVTVMASGTRGDVQPAIALAKALVEQGHQVSLLAGKNFRRWIESHGLTAVPTRVDMQALMESEGGREWVERGHNPLVQKRLMKKLIDRYGWEMAMDSWDACRNADAIISSFTSDTYASAFAEKLRVPQISMPLQPALIATRDGRSVPNAPRPRGPSVLNLWFSKALIEPFPWQLYGELTSRVRQELGLPPQTARENQVVRRRTLTLQAFSPSVVPHPADWPPNVHTTGYWFLDDSPVWEPPPELVSFLESGEPPIYVGFGSMTGRNAGQTTRLLVDSLEKSGQRAIVSAGWAESGDVRVPDSMFRIDDVPHSWLFPRVAAVVHHGGAGTTAAGLRAGVPSLIIPHFADQPFWGKRVHDLGAGPKPIARHRLSVDNLAAGIVEAVTDARLRERSAALGETIRSEQGLDEALRRIEL